MSDDARAAAHVPSSDYDAIEQAVMETARGRWFLREYAARNRTADTTVLLDAIGKLERAVTGERATEQIEHVRFDLMEMAKSISRLKSEIDATTHDGQEQSHFDEATNALDEIVRTTERATSSILESAEAIQEVAWSLREQQVDEDVCEKIDRLATDIYTACAFQDLTAQRTQKVVRTLRFLEGRINALVDVWAGSPQQSPAPRPAEAAGEGVAAALSQSDVDIVIVDHEIQGLAPDPAPMIAAPVAEPPFAPAEERRTQLADLAADIQQLADTEAESLMVADVEIIEVDDMVADDIAFIDGEADQTADLTARPPVALAPRSLAEIDALPTTAKALIFG
jgi:chemotaxis regulatin CheY-phosphate phosphatase CheZ